MIRFARIAANVQQSFGEFQGFMQISQGYERRTLKLEEGC